MKEKPDCIFCQIVHEKVFVPKIVETNNFIVIADKFPKAPGHALIIPKKHFVTILDIPNNLGEELLQLTKKVSEKILESKTGDGFNIVMNNLPASGQAIEHAHIHIIPRKEGDGLKSMA